MKILVVSLLRLGDVLLTAPAISQLHRLHPDAEIQILVNRESAKAVPHLPHLSKAHIFERDLLQQGLGEAERSLLESYDRLNQLVFELNQENFDWVINLTQTHLSGYLLSLVESPKQTGLSLDLMQNANFNSPWFQFLNQSLDLEDDEAFHFSDLFQFSVGANETLEPMSLLRTEAGRKEAHSILHSMSGTNSETLQNFFAIQPLTSDVKKNWGLDRFSSLIKSFYHSHAEIPIVILHAPFETVALQPLREWLEKEAIPVHWASCSFSAALSILDHAKYLLTGDTSVKHLASATNAKIIELSLGSSSLHRTGAYQDGSIIIQTQEACAPCEHSSSCFQKSHLCGERVSVDAVSAVIDQVVAQNHLGLRTVAVEFQEEIQVWTVNTKSVGFWAAIPQHSDPAFQSAVSWLDLLGRRFFLQSKVRGKEVFNELGNESLRFGRLLRKAYPNLEEQAWKTTIENFERQAMLVDMRVIGLESGLNHLRSKLENESAYSQFKQTLLVFRDKIRPHVLLRGHTRLLDLMIENSRAPGFAKFRHLQDGIQEMAQRNSIELQVLRTLSQHMEITK